MHDLVSHTTNELRNKTLTILNYGEKEINKNNYFQK